MYPARAVQAPRRAPFFLLHFCAQKNEVAEGIKRRRVEKTDYGNARDVVFCRSFAGYAGAGKGDSGHCDDASTGEPLPAATVHVLGAYDGTISNTEGKYMLSLRSLPAVVEVRYIGYRSQQYHVTEDAADVRDFALAPVPIELETLVVMAEGYGSQYYA